MSTLNNPVSREPRPSVRDLKKDAFMDAFIAERDAESSSDSVDGAKGEVFPMSTDLNSAPK